MLGNPWHRLEQALGIPACLNDNSFHFARPAYVPAQSHAPISSAADVADECRDPADLDIDEDEDGSLDASEDDCEMAINPVELNAGRTSTAVASSRPPLSLPPPRAAASPLEATTFGALRSGSELDHPKAAAQGVPVSSKEGSSEDGSAAAAADGRGRVHWGALPAPAPRAAPLPSQTAAARGGRSAPRASSQHHADYLEHVGRYDSTRALLDQLMGADRDAPIS